MTEPLFHWPSLWRAIAFIIAPTAIPLLFREFLCLWFRTNYRAPIFRDRVVLAWVCLMVLNAVVRDDVMAIPNLLWMVWMLFGSKSPWDKWKKKLMAKASSLTEVMTAALKRQQTEALS